MIQIHQYICPGINDMHIWASSYIISKHGALLLSHKDKKYVSNID